MFKAKLIEDSSYYKLKKKHLIISILPSIPMGLIINSYSFPLELTILMIVFYVGLVAVVHKNQKIITALIDQRKIEIDKTEIRIKSKKGEEKESIKINKIDKLFLKDEYIIPSDSLSSLSREMKGNAKQNYLEIEQNNSKRRFDFELDSYYMIKQLDKLIVHWEDKGYNIIRTN